MDLIAYLKESSIGSINSILNMAKIIIPLMIIMEILKDSNVLETISKRLKPISRFFDISNETVFPMMIGLIFGLVYGAGVIIESTDGKELRKKDLYVLIIFLVSCHAIFEDTLIFVTVGANLWMLFITRLIVATITAYFASKIIDRSLNNKIFESNK
ncbi:nucleoside recognition domain-containing protein [Clostridium sp. Cult2]|uniref:nucleoside recognition domain-containing protein n=1 Tax=Clostridium sp. Cult2 TaxID=2079003 RepID=UPI001F2B1F88|nr:nucleoside recognition domain-containing protein [Clostridium sp. Cult2]MCF6465706.1 nucleoside recognition protein [Clostridium sp. Cult2]